MRTPSGSNQNWIKPPTYASLLRAGLLFAYLTSQDLGLDPVLVQETPEKKFLIAGPC